MKKLDGTKWLVTKGTLVLALCGVLVMAASVASAEEVAFNKTKFSSVKQPKEAEVSLLLTDSKIVIKSKKTSKKMAPISLVIPYSAIDAMSYGLASRHRTAEGAAVMGLSLGAGAIVMATKTKSYWLAVDYHEADTKQSIVLRLDKSEYRDVIGALETKANKHVAVVDVKSSSELNPTTGSRDVEEVVSFGVDKVAAALKAAMESQGCNVKTATDDRIECKRPRGASERTGVGGEKVTATIKANGEQTRVRIWTGKGFSGRMRKRNWSTPIYQEMMKGLQSPAPSV